MFYKNTGQVYGTKIRQIFCLCVGMAVPMSGALDLDLIAFVGSGETDIDLLIIYGDRNFGNSLDQTFKMLRMAISSVSEKIPEPISIIPTFKLQPSDVIAVKATTLLSDIGPDKNVWPVFFFRDCLGILNKPAGMLFHEVFELFYKEALSGHELLH